ncbi:MAG: histidine--tRNA ligase [Lentisphaeria bacterium]
MAAKMEPVPGTDDIWEPEVLEWQRLENVARQVFRRYGYGELRTPVFERTDVFVRGIGDETEVVQKEMYTFEDRGGRSLTLRPEGTAGTMRAIANQGIAQGEEKRVFCIGPMFRGERPAAGRKRQFHQISVEAVGKCTPVLDAECITMLVDYLGNIGLTDINIQLNSRGTLEDRQRIAPQLQEFFQKHKKSLCDDCRRRIDTNVWRILDCKNAECQALIEQSPPIPELLSEASKEYFDRVCGLLNALGISYNLNPRLVRGLDYYEHTVFEITSEAEGLGAQNALAGGGRYLINLPGSKKPVQGVGFGIGMERLLLALHPEKREPRGMGKVEVFVAGRGEKSQAERMHLAQELREAGVAVVAEHEDRSLKAQFRTANRLEAALVLIQAEEEISKQSVSCKDMRNSEQDECPRDQVLGWVKKRLQK